MRDIVIVAHDMRSAHNVGSLLRTAEGLGIQKVYLTGYTPHPPYAGDGRLPHIAAKLEKQIDKTALGAQKMIPWQYEPDIHKAISRLKADGYGVIALEQAEHSIKLPGYKAPEKVALLLGTEVEGLPSDLLALASCTLEIPMFGQKESFNVVQATAMALYNLRFY